MNGFINLLKPPGMSSGAAVAVVKRLSREKVGHAGTLDPEAAGVLPIMVGRAARLLDYFPDKSKSYVAEIAFAGATDTQDAQGTVIEEARRVPGRDEILAVLSQFRGDILQRPPAYSALKRDGVPLYELVRKGIAVETKARPTVIRTLELGEQTGSDGYMLEVDCGSGTYIRTLCHDIGQALRTPAHMRFLLRTRHGEFTIENAVTIEEVIAAGERKEIESLLLQLARNGGKLPAELMPQARENQHIRVYAEDVLLGVAHKTQDLIRFDVGLTGGN